MGYEELKEYFTEYHLGRITKYELACMIYIWQRTEGYVNNTTLFDY